MQKMQWDYKIGVTKTAINCVGWKFFVFEDSKTWNLLIIRNLNKESNFQKKILIGQRTSILINKI